MILETFPVGPLQCNCAVLGDEASREAVIIDPGDEAEKVKEVLDQHRLTPRWIVHTHAHIDHILAADAIRGATGARVGLHPADRFLWEGVQTQAAWLGVRVPPIGPVDRDLREGDTLPFGAGSLRVIETPGHTPGSVCFLLEGAGGARPDPAILFTGDTLFSHGIGRTDLWGGSYPGILGSIRDRLFTLDEETTVHPGHGGLTTIGEERRSNPFRGDILKP